MSLPPRAPRPAPSALSRAVYDLVPLSYAARNILLGDAAEAQHPPVSRRGAEIHDGHRPQPQVAGCSFVAELAISETFGQRDGKVHAGLGAMDLELVAEHLAYVLLQQSAPFPVERSHSADVPREVAGLDELREHRLMQIRRCNVDGLSNGDEAVDQVGRHDHVAESQRRKQHFAARPDIDDAIVAVESLQG